jgi:hypothetical protein
MENRKAHRVVFERGYAANMMAIDGTWRRPCTMEDVSDKGRQTDHRRLDRGFEPEGIFPSAFNHGQSISALPTSLGQWRSGRRPFPEAGEQEETLGPLLGKRGELKAL